MTNPKRPTDPRHAQSGADPATSTDDAAEDQAAKIAEKTATFVPLSLRSEAPEVLEAAMPTARQHVARAKPGDPHEVRRFMRPVAELLVSCVKSGETLDPEINLHPDNIDYFVNTICADRSEGWRHETQWVLTLVGQKVVSHLHPAKRRGVGSTGPLILTALMRTKRSCLAGLRCDLGWRGDARLAVAVNGAGMKGPEARAAQPSDLFDIDDGRLGMQVKGRHSRLVPIRKPYVDLARAVLETADDGPFIVDASHIAVRYLSVPPTRRGGSSAGSSR